ncbi:DoxX family protein [Paludibacteraceae bacterium OttesenSCG-928-F17]|nr:DoxX family protein [Paludibacteraceae bacterium OttesenSCG-928-F17]
MNKNLNCTARFLLGNENNTLKNVGLLIFRLLVGVFMLTHGWAKLSSFESMKLVFPDPLGVGSGLSLSLIIVAEFGCSILIILGLFTRLAVLPLMFGMIIAAFVIHGADPFAVKELSLLYLGLYAALLFTGAGRYSADRLIFVWWDKKFPYIDK